MCDLLWVIRSCQPSYRIFLPKDSVNSHGFWDFDIFFKAEFKYSFLLFSKFSIILHKIHDFWNIRGKQILYLGIKLLFLKLLRILSMLRPSTLVSKFLFFCHFWPFWAIWAILGQIIILGNPWNAINLWNLYLLDQINLFLTNLYYQCFYRSLKAK